MCAIYSEELSAERVEAETWWVRFIPKEGAALPRHGSVPMTVTLGLGEVHSVPYDPATLHLTNGDIHEAVLGWIHQHMRRLGKARGWDLDALEQVERRCTGRIGIYSAACGAKWDSRRRFRALAGYEIDGVGDGWTTVTVVDRAGNVVRRERFDSPCEPQAARRIGASMRWTEHGLAITPWPEKFAPRQQFAGERIVGVGDA